MSESDRVALLCGITVVIGYSIYFVFSALKKRFKARVKSSPRPHEKWMWRLFLPFMTYKRRQWLAKWYGYQADNRCKDAIAETLATNEEILNVMYGRSPSMSEIYQEIKDQYTR